MNASLRRLAALLPLLLLGITTAGCNMMDHDEDDDMPDPMRLRGDVQFIDYFAPHHVAATEMADMVIARGADAEVKAFARKIRAAQRTEVQTMRTARLALTGKAEMSMAHDDPHMSTDMAAMGAASGTALDRLFLEDMIPHHAGGIAAAHNAAGLTRADIQALARKIYEDQSAEIGEMRALRARIGG